MTSYRADGWLLYTTENRVHAGNDGYADDVSAVYVWDDTVPNHSDPKVGDLVALWDGGRLLGMSVISEITRKPSSKPRYRCPECNTTNIRRRQHKTPIFRCGRCGAEFEEPAIELIDVETYRANYAAGWVDADGISNGSELRSICVNPKSQHSIRLLNRDGLENLLEKYSMGDDFRLTNGVRSIIQGGHKDAVVRARIGQGDFRKHLLDTYGPQCAISGPAPTQAIHACHLYSYAKAASHEDDGGLLLRSDLHSLFDRGLIRVDPDSAVIVLDQALREYSDYWRFNGRRLMVALTERQTKWLRLHWNQHSGRAQ